MVSVRADRDKCQGYGNCAGLVPNAFEVGDDNTVVVLRESFPESDTSLLREAAKMCPMAALTIETS